MCCLCRNNCFVRGDAGGEGAITTQLKSGPGTEWPRQKADLGVGFCLCNSAKNLIDTNHVPQEKLSDSQENKVIVARFKSYRKSHP